MKPLPLTAETQAVLTRIRPHDLAPDCPKADIGPTAK